MSKYSTKEVWNEVYGKLEEIEDYTGRLMKKAACGDLNSAYCPTIDHVRPLSQGGEDSMRNIILCHKNTNEEKADCFPHWKANNHRYKVIKVNEVDRIYRIVEY